jgi:hypothetical protein
MKSELEIRCGCSRRPLLAVAGRDTKTKHGFIHIKSWKGNRLYTEVVVTEGIAHIRCRECLHWTKVRIVKDVSVNAEELPATIGV